MLLSLGLSEGAASSCKAEDLKRALEAEVGLGTSWNLGTRDDEKPKSEDQAGHIG